MIQEEHCFAKGNIWKCHLQSQCHTQEIYISTLYIKFHPIQALPTYQHPSIQETRKLIHDFIYTQETCYMKWKAHTA